MRDTSDFEMPVSTPIAATRSSTERVDTPLHVGLHDHRVQRLIDASSRLEQLGKNDALAQLRDPQREISGLRRQRPRPTPLRCVTRSSDAFVAASADPFLAD